jgi:hypothetical protein
MTSSKRVGRSIGRSLHRVRERFVGHRRGSGCPGESLFKFRLLGLHFFSKDWRFSQSSSTEREFTSIPFIGSILRQRPKNHRLMSGREHQTKGPRIAPGSLTALGYIRRRDGQYRNVFARGLFRATSMHLDIKRGESGFDSYGDRPRNQLQQSQLPSSPMSMAPAQPE